MERLQLIEPNVQLEQEYLAMLAEWQVTREKLTPFVLKMDPSDFPAMVAKLKNYSQGINIPESFVAHSTYWLVDSQNQLLGVVNIRPKLNAALLQRGGHIGYGIRPSERRKGYAKAILKLALEKVKTLGIEKALVTCDKNNIASAKTIVANGGILENEITIDGEIVQRYWIAVKS